MNQVGQSVGINFKWGGKMGSTLNAHRLMHLARSKPKDIQSALLERIFRAFHEQEEDIASPALLIQLAVESGIDEAEATTWMNSDMGSDAVIEEAQKYRDIRAQTGVPAYIVQGEHRLEGSQDAQDLLELFIKIKEA
ncbi:thioredoxin-like protein [Stachybotrys elegans]|uniref:Thioredoxin-like protein n=1 Tax=Stachybotrys elegans TaxID=80388 RepID=A0A8K0SH27_9HYPO|nr:thioredoxin-like protein [Stachybotrys elegans]